MTKRTTYKGHALLVLDPDGKFPFQFGLTKARLILDNLGDIQKFVDDQVTQAAEQGMEEAQGIR